MNSNLADKESCPDDISLPEEEVGVLYHHGNLLNMTLLSSRTHTEVYNALMQCKGRQRYETCYNQ